MDKKICFKCDEEKTLDHFYKHPGMKDGRLNKCKECAKNDVGKHRELNLEKIRAYDRKRGSTTARIAENSRRMCEYREKFPLKYKAKTMVNNAVRDGRIIKPTLCSCCNKEGRQIEGHHDDYSKPLEVVWMCSACHSALHRDLANVGNKPPATIL